MDKEFWREIQKNDYAVPQDHSVPDMTQELLSYLGSTDPELRDEFTMPILAYWIERGIYLYTELQQMRKQLCNNLEIGLGDEESDTVFLRTFSIEMLAEIIHHDNKQSFLEKDEVQQVLNRAVSYLEQERDLRGYVPIKGWAHSTAHTADLLMVLAQNRHVSAQGLVQILQAIAKEITHPVNSVYLYDEDERLVNAVLAVLNRNLLDMEVLQPWLDSLANPPDQISWENWFMDDQVSRAYINTKGFVRSFYLRLEKAETPPEVTLVLLPELKKLLDIFSHHR